MKLLIYTPPKPIGGGSRGKKHEVILITKNSDGMCFVHRQWQRPEDTGPNGKWYHKRFWTHKDNLSLHPSRIVAKKVVAPKPKPGVKKAKPKTKTLGPISKKAPVKPKRKAHTK